MEGWRASSSGIWRLVSSAEVLTLWERNQSGRMNRCFLGCLGKVSFCSRTGMSRVGRVVWRVCHVGWRIMNVLTTSHYYQNDMEKVHLLFV